MTSSTEPTTYKILWTKTYYTTGEFIVEATDEVEGEGQGHRLIGDQEGSLHYMPYENAT